MRNHLIIIRYFSKDERWMYCKDIVDGTGVQACVVRKALESFVQKGWLEWKREDDTSNDKDSLNLKAQELGRGVRKLFRITNKGQHDLEEMLR